VLVLDNNFDGLDKRIDVFPSAIFQVPLAEIPSRVRAESLFVRDICNRVAASFAGYILEIKSGHFSTLQ
jgi:hypothetical protein